MKIFMKLVYQCMAIFFSFSPTSNHLYPLQVENCDSNSRLVADEDDNVKSGLKGLNLQNLAYNMFHSSSAVRLNDFFVHFKLVLLMQIRL